MEALGEVLVFGAKVLLLVFGVVLVIAAIAKAARRGDEGAGQLRVKRLDERLAKTRLAMRLSMAKKKDRKSLLQSEKRRRLEASTPRAKAFVLDFDGNMRASQVEALREEVTAILQVAEPGDEVVVKLKSPGGVVYGYGLASNQLERVRERGVKLTAVVDQVAASGGYMMAVVADRIVAAPFAILGSIGVVAGIPNLHRWMRKHDIDYELVTAGRYKRTLTVFGENTEEGRKKFQEELEAAHALFKGHCVKYRPALDLDKVATGEHWFGLDALGLGLVDQLGTSDDYVGELAKGREVYEVKWVAKKRLGDRLGLAVENAVARVMDRLLGAGEQRNLP